MGRVPGKYRTRCELGGDQRSRCTQTIDHEALACLVALSLSTKSSAKPYSELKVCLGLIASQPLHLPRKFSRTSLTNGPQTSGVVTFCLHGYDPSGFRASMAPGACGCPRSPEKRERSRTHAEKGCKDQGLEILKLQLNIEATDSSLWSEGVSVECASG